MDPQNTYATSYGEIIIKVIILKILEFEVKQIGLLTKHNIEHMFLFDLRPIHSLLK